MTAVRLIGRLIKQLGTPKFGAALFDLANSHLPISGCAAHTLDDKRTPTRLVAEGFNLPATIRASTFASRFAGDGPENSARIEMRIVGRQEFETHDPEFGSALHLLRPHATEPFLISLYRTRDVAPFTKANATCAKQFASLATPALMSHQRLSPNLYSAPEIGEPDQWHNRLFERVSALLKENDAGLTRREAQVCAALILGSRPSAIGVRLGLTESTICTHRKRAYAKLGMSSQNELFARYFDSISKLDEVDETHAVRT